MSRLLDRKGYSSKGSKLVSESKVSERPRALVTMRRVSQDNQLPSLFHNQHQAISGHNEDGEDEELVMGANHANGDDNDAEDVPVSCGVGSWRPSWLQKCYNNKMALVLLSWFAVLQGFVVNGLNNVNTTSYERRYQLTSTEAGLVSSAYDFAAGLAVVIPSYFGSKGHKPRWLACSAFLFAIGSFVMTLPKLLADNYSPPTSSEQTAFCHVNSTSCPPPSDADDAESLRFFGKTFSFPSSYKYLGLLIMGQGLHGLGGSILYSLGTVFIDDNVPQTSSPFYISIFYSFAAVGPAIGYIVGGEFLKFYVDFPTVDAKHIPVEIGNATSLTDQDAAWVGAWWLGFSIASVLFLTVAAALLCFDKELPEAAVVRRTRVSEHHFSNNFRHKVSSKYTLWHLPRHAFRLLRNPVFACASISAAMEGAVLSGFATFLPKFIQSRFSQSAFMAALLTGVVVVPSGALAQFASGFVARKLRLKVRGQIISSIISLLLSIALSAAFLLNCEHAPIVGVDEPYEKVLNPQHYEEMMKSSYYTSSAQLGLQSTCNNDCGCSTRAYRPICANGRYQFFSPCHAGCVSKNEKYENCSCLPSRNYTSTSTLTSLKSRVADPLEYNVVDGLCPGECPALYIFLALFFLVVFFTFYVQVPLNTITLRSTSDAERPFAIGLQWVLIRFLGTVPGPIVFGSVIDSSCIVWQESQTTQQCGEGSTRQGACWLYNTKTTSIYLMGVGMVIHLISLLANVAALAIYRPPPGVDVTDPLSRAMGRLCLCRRNGRSNGCLANAGVDGDDDKEEDIIAPSSSRGNECRSGGHTNAGSSVEHTNGGPTTAGSGGGGGGSNGGGGGSSLTPSGSLTRAFHRNKSSDQIALVHCQDEPIQQAPPTPTPSPSAEQKFKRPPAIRHFMPSNS